MAKLIYKREGRTYYYSQIPILDKRGRHTHKYRRESTHTTSYQEAMKIARLREKRQMEGVGEREDPFLLEGVDEFVRLTEAEGKSDIKNQKTFRRYIEPHTKKLFISDLDQSLIRKLRRVHTKDNYSANYTNNLVAFLISVYNYARDEKLDVSEANFKDVKLKTKRKTRFFLDGEEQKFLKEIDPAREANGMPSYADRIKSKMYIQTALQDQYDLCVFLIDTGVRHTEASEALRSSVGLDWKYINIYREKVGNEGNIALTNRLREVLQRRLHNSNSPYIFPRRHDPSKPRTYAMDGVRKAINRAELNAEHLVKRYGTFTPHCFRHSFASKLAQNGLDLLSISKLLGHSTTQMTQRYAHLIHDRSADQAAEILNNLN